MITRSRGPKAAFTLIEVVVSVTIVALTAISIISTLSYGIYLKQSIREQNGAMRIAGTIIEDVKRTALDELEERTINNVLIDDRGTADTDDDVLGTATIRFFEADGTRVARPTPRRLIRMEVEVSWRAAGRNNADPKRRTLNTLLAP